VFAFHRINKESFAMSVHAISASPSPTQNHLLAALHDAEYERLLPDEMMH